MPWITTESDMTTIEVCEPTDVEMLLQRRRDLGQDHHDEVWDGVYVMAPYANDEHQELVCQIGAILWIVIGFAGLAKVRPGVNISDRKTNWTVNYRVPDLAVFLAGCAAQNHGSHWFGGPDWAAEVVSPGDRSREKLTFTPKWAHENFSSSIAIPGPSNCTCSSGENFGWSGARLQNRGSFSPAPSCPCRSVPSPARRVPASTSLEVTVRKRGVCRN
jgi:hypothetical protein